MSSDSWCSPPEITRPLVDFFRGPVDCDPCSNERSIVHARIAFTWGGLWRRWRAPGQKGLASVYQNEPYSQSGAWTDKMVYEMRHGVGELVRLTMFAASTAWWAKGCKAPKYNPRIIATKRLKFIDPEALIAGQLRMTCRFEPALIYYGPRTALFDRTFRHVQRWSTWGR